MQMQPRVLYNLLRMNWLVDSSVEAEPWQVEDYRALSFDDLFGRLEDHKVFLDRASFLAYAEESDSPEDLTDHILSDRDELDVREHDQVYLVMFELWRRLVPEHLCLTVFCDELDHQVSLYDRGELSDGEALQDAVAGLQQVLDENVDEGGEPEEVFNSISEICANNLEGFLYDYATDQLDQNEGDYAAELIEGFYRYVSDTRWFDFLKARMLVESDLTAANKLFAQLIVQISEGEPDLDFCLELMVFMVQGGERKLFIALVTLTLKWLKTEDDFQELLSICVDYYARLDYDWEEESIQAILDTYVDQAPDVELDPNNPHIQQLLDVMHQRTLT